MALQYKLTFLTCLAPTSPPSMRDVSFVSLKNSHSCFVNYRFIPKAEVARHVKDDPKFVRRTANYHPSIWDFEFVQSLKSSYNEDGRYDKHVKKLKENVQRMLITKSMRCVAQLELIDSLERFGLGYHFEEDIKRVLDTIATRNHKPGHEEELHATSLRFRLLRQHGYDISQGVFSPFMNNRGTFKKSICEDIKGMLSLYEASNLAFEEDNNLTEAKAFTVRHLRNNLKNIVDPHLAKQVRRSLETPLHWRMQRLEARWYINECTIEGGTNPDLLDLAKLDFNMVQTIHQNDLRAISRWWRNVGLGSKLSFTRDRVVEHFLWTVGLVPHPKFDRCRKELTKVAALITTIDDMYDVYGSLDELKLFTDSVERWDISAIEELPNYMRICFLALYNTVNEMAYDTLKEQGWNITPYLHKAWADLCKAFLVEAKWYFNKYTPTLEEYLDNAWISVSGHVILVHAYFLAEKQITKEGLEYMQNYPNIIYWASMIFRLCNDLATSTVEQERGDVSTSIQCFMHQTGVSEKVAREHIRSLIGKTWNKMNKDQRTDSPMSQDFRPIPINLARTVQTIYTYGDGHSISNTHTKDYIKSSLADPILLVQK